MWRALTVLTVLLLLFSATFTLAQTGPAEEGGDAAAAQPVEDSPLLRDPETPLERLKAVDLVLRLGRPKLAKQYLEQLVSENLSDDELVSLRDELGPAFFVKLSGAEALQPLGTQFANSVTKAFAERGANPERINSLIDDLTGKPADRVAARQTLINTGKVVVPVVLTRLYQARPGDDPDDLIEVLRGIGKPALPMLHAAVSSQNPDFASKVVEAIERIGSTDSYDYLLYPAMSTDVPTGLRLRAATALRSLTPPELSAPRDAGSAALQLMGVGMEQYLRAARLQTKDEANAFLWSWNDDKAELEWEEVTAEQHAIATAEQFARQAFLMWPEQKDTQALFLATALAKAKMTTGETEGLPTGPGTVYETAQQAGYEVVTRSLAISLDVGERYGAMGALIVLGGITPSRELNGKTGEVLQQAMNAADIRVQFAAAIAALRLRAEEPYPSANRVVEILSRALVADEKTAVIVDPNPQRGAMVAGFLNEMGYDSIVRTETADGFRMAAENTAADITLLNLNVSRPTLRAALAAFRADSRTKSMPVIVYGPGEFRSKVERVTSRTDRSGYISYTVLSRAFIRQLLPIARKYQPRPALTLDERLQQQKYAAYWLANIANERREDVYPLDEAERALINSMQNPDLTENCLVALSSIPTATAQNAILETLHANTGDPQATTLAQGLVTHVRRFGLLLRGKQLNQLYELMTNSENADVRDALASLSGMLSPTPKASAETLKRLTVSQQ
ncbi:HEAT repeat domain-containing protein [Calycomorphotria hydatis]|uniref:Response regulatory domain-containing protein n=1 Tax=Calycomorphotria hydatis TaxID=2528027 RepID=A0A517T9C5_9PLAN|nr:HEAT repeat domain-containing protein [Calycomorphotria hydatis]QDT64984.1 hypothetical protein V22_22300 [Calycomorphotria hydatis]